MFTIRSAVAARLLSLLAFLAVEGAAIAGDLLTTVDSGGAVGASSSMQLDSAGRPVIAYRDSGNGDLKLATCTAGCGTSAPTWQIVTVDGASGTNVGTDINLRLGPGGNPVIAYGVPIGFGDTDDLKVATCHAGCNGPTPSWHVVTVDSAGNVGRYASMELAAAGNPVISYHDTTNGDLKLATCVAGCQSAAPTWQIVKVESTDFTGLYTSLKLDSAGNPVIAFRHRDAGELRLATCTAGCQGASPTWAIATVASGGVGFHASMQLAAGDIPIISYFDPFAASVMLATCTANCRTGSSSWQLATVEAVGVLHTSLRLDALGRPMVAYFVSPGAQDLKLAECTANCASATPTWQVTTVDSAGDVGGSPSLQIPGHARAAISYQDSTNADLKLAFVGLRPSVVSVARAAANPTNATQLQFVVAFSAPVTGADVSDFSVATTGLSGASVGSVAGAGSTYTVTVNSGIGSGTLRLDVVDDDTILFGSDPLGGPGAGNGPFTTGEAYTIDRVGPTITFVNVPAAGNYVTGQFLDFRVSWSENVSTATGYPSLAVTIGSATRQAAYAYRIGSDWYFQYKVTAPDNDEDGIAIAGTLTLDGAVLHDDAGNAAASDFTLVGPTTDVRVNRALVVTIPTTTSTVYTSGQSGMRSALQLNNDGRPVIAYEEWGAAIRVSTCVANCVSASPTWVHAVVEPGNTLLGAMELSGGKPVVTYSLNSDLRIATCTANCESAAPTWVHATVEAGAWKRSALQIDGGVPVIAYVDASGKLKVARCGADCATTNPTWIKAEIDSAPPNGYGSLWNPSLQLRDGKPVVTYDTWGTSLKYAACLSGCSTATPTWGVSTIEAVSAVRSSLRLVAGAPVVAYHAQGDLKVATCVADCATATPTWQVVAVDTTDNTGAGASLQIADGRPVVSYYDATNVRLRLASCTARCSTATPSWTFATLSVGGYPNDVDTSLQLAGPRAFISYHTWSDWNLEFAVVEGTALSRSPSELVFGGQSTGTNSPAQSVTLTNAGMLPLPIASVAASDPQYEVAHDCTVLAPLASCTIAVSFSPDPAPGPLNSTAQVPATLAITSAAPGPPHSVTLSGVAERSLVTHYYRSILGRAADAGGHAFWQAEAARVASLGANVNEAWFAMAASFYFSPEYLALNRTSTQFVTDLYRTFFNRAPDQGGLDFWVANLTLGMPREVVLVSYMFSAEFRGFTQAIFGNTAARAEVDTVMDFYRGLLSRLPDDGGFNFWIGRFRTAQCGGSAAVTDAVEAISSAFALSGEYTGRNRTNAQYVGDLYNAFLRRGGDLGGVQFWISQLDSGARTREQVRVEFKNSAEFQARVAAIIAQGCL